MKPTESDPEARITEVLAEHIYYGPGECRCGWGKDTEVSATIEHFFAHQAEVIAALPDIAIVELPKPDGRGRWGSVFGVREDGYLKWSVGVDDASVPFARASRGSGDAKGALSDYKSFAAALLAATRYAGGGS